ncbi:hypothetical protein SFR_7075 (plasmid) [Streptomyces sp. FR-008]|nr:hypothetical protein SFR_7075 [Streptomyces sp. FR-008]
MTRQHVAMTTDDEHDQDHGAAPPGALGQVFSQKGAAEACGTTVTTIRRWRQAGKTPHAYQVAGGAWMYPLADLLAAGATVNPPSPPDPPAPSAGGEGSGSAAAGEGEEATLRAELERVRGELAEARHAAELAGQEAGHLRARLSERADHIKDLQQALAALSAAPERAALTGPAAAPPAVPEQQSAPAGEESGEGERRPWWRVGRR